MDRNPERNLSRLKPGLREIYFYLTRGCNLRCRHCWINPGHQTESRMYPELKVGHFTKVLEQALPLGLSRVKLTGGEPLLHSKIGEILSIIADTNASLFMETNGILCTPSIAEKISRCKKPFISVSLDAADSSIHEEIRGVKGCFESTLAGIRNLVNTGATVQLIMTVMGSNKNQVEPLIELAESLQVKSVKFNVLQPSGRGESLHKTGEALTIEEMVRLSKWVETELASGTKLRLIFDHPPAFIPLDLIIEGRQYFSLCDVFGALGVISSGKYALCGVGENVPGMIFGDVEQDSLKDIWENNSILADLRRNLPAQMEGICSNCLLNDLCFGSCIAQNYVRSKSLWASNWFCQSAADAGLFPGALLRDAPLQEDDEQKRAAVIRSLESLKQSNPKLFYLDAPGKTPDWVETLNEIFS